MKPRRLNPTLVSLLVLSLGLGACGTEPGEDPPNINVMPATLDEASASLSTIDDRLRANPDDTAARAALDQLMPQLDKLNHLVARVTLETGNVVSFYEPEAGFVGVSETGPATRQPVLRQEDVEASSPVALYRRLTKAEPPSALVQAHERQLVMEAQELPAGVATDLASSPIQSVTPVTGAEQGTTKITSALVEADGPWFAANGCFRGQADFKGCYPNMWGNGAFAQAYTKTSFLTVAPFWGDFISVRMKYSGSTKFTYPVYNGQWASYWYHSSGYTNIITGKEYDKRTHRWELLNAAIDGYHWSHAFKWTCTGQYNCNLWP